MLRTAHLRWLLPCALVLLDVAQSVAADNGPALTFRSTVSEVQLTFVTTDGHNHTVSDLNGSDFAVVDDELVVRQFRSFRRLQSLALSITVLVDRSGSVSARSRQLTDIIQLIAQAPLRADDKIAVVAFGVGRPTLICSGKCTPENMERRFARIPPDSQTDFFDALVFAASLSPRPSPGTRSTIFVFSDGDDNLSRNSVSDAISAALAHETEIYAFDLNRPGSASRGSFFLQKLAEETGGNYFSFDGNASDYMRTLIGDLRSAYTITYVPPLRSSGIHSVQILPTRNLGLRFRSRQAYVYETDHQN
jgi:VWFA-related protein